MIIQGDFCAFDTEDDSKRFSDAGQAHPGYEKTCTQIAAIDFRTNERFHYRPLANRHRKRGRWKETLWDVTPFLQWLEERGPNTRVYAHNLAYDIGNIWRDCLDELDVTMVGNRLVRAKWRNVILLDSSNVWPMPLAKVGDSVGLKKLDMDVESEEYVFRDVEIVGAAMRVAEELASEFGADMKSTLGSLSVAIWNGPVLGGWNWQCSAPEIRNAYYGGRVELFKTGAKGPHLWYTDINSLYPAMMLRKFPEAADLNFGADSLEAAEAMLLSDCELYGAVHVDLEIPETLMLCPLPVKREGSGEVCFPVGPASGWWTVHEVRKALSMGTRLVRLHDAYGCTTGVAYYADFVRTFYRLRQEELNKGEDGDPAKTLFYKLLMNNLYGQLGMRGSVTRSVHLTDDMVEETPEGLVLLQPGVPYGSKLLTDVEIPLPPHVNYLHACYVTSYGRLTLLEYMEKVGAENLIYCDTDSLFFEWKGEAPPFPLSTNLGEMKLEDRPMWVETRSPKMYRYETAKKGRTTKAKGVPKRMQDTFYDEGCASFWQPWRLKESIASMNRIPDEDDEEVKILGVWRQVMKRVVSGYDKKRLGPDGVTYLPKKMVDIGADWDTVPVA